MIKHENPQSINRLEEAMLLAKEGQMSSRSFVEVLLDSIIAVPSSQNPGDSIAKLAPLIVDRNGITMVVAFTESSRALKFAGMASYLLTCTTRQLLPILCKDVGLVVNPGYEVGFEISPQGVTDIVADFAA